MNFVTYGLSKNEDIKLRELSRAPIYSRMIDAEYRRHYSDIMVWEWSDYDDGERKYYENPARDLDQTPNLMSCSLSHFFHASSPIFFLRASNPALLRTVVIPLLLE